MAASTERNEAGSPSPSTQEKEHTGSRYNLHMQKPREYIFAQLNKTMEGKISGDENNSMFSQVVNIAFSQMSAKKRIKKHGKEGVATIFKEYEQLHNKEVFQRIKKQRITPEIQ
mmetsp:Transcript_9529/g.13508  ORF Transcript_9529/g.13508 Transcript_9529/m.13508 type:complete len:114 (+) Transcript_9529:2818-3159(+)